ncbi:hypothetical protein MLD38_003997 [Melastoma candidum]|uniref:Uncharacterized protein n=1 Tax=Melastoma candidum TaxID=119954 RepID=A0ACB9S4F8_9MYRT|nr:hypothetical protein MLD38_003997 [Melastoma candidum]
MMYNHDFNDPYPPLDYSPSPSTPPVITIPDHHLCPCPCSDFDSVNETMKALGYPDTPYNSSSSCCSSGGSCITSPSSFPSRGSRAAAVRSFMQRSCSTLSLQKNYGYRLPFGSTPEFAAADAEDSSVRRVCSDGDLQRINGGSQQGQRSGGSQLMSESNMILQGLSRTLPYGPEEKKERIERYRSKRTQRNFNKKIKYACRKTLADSRPRIRGRFARNEEIEKTEPELHRNHRMEQGQYNEEEAEPEDDSNWVEFLDTFSSGNLLL